MLRIKQHRFIWVGIILLGVILLGIPAVYASDQSENSIPLFSTRKTKAVAAGAVYVVYSPNCVSLAGTNYRATGGGCSLQYAGVRNGLEASRPTPNLNFALPTGWECRGKNYASRTIHVTVHVICTRVP